MANNMGSNIIIIYLLKQIILFYRIFIKIQEECQKCKLLQHNLQEKVFLINKLQLINKI